MPEELKPLSEDDIKFLVELQNELNTQSTDGQADPRFWVVAESKKEFGFDSGYSDGTVVADSDGGAWEEPKEFIDYLIENGYLSKSDFDPDYDYDLDEILEILDNSEFYTCGYREVRNAIAPDTMFITKRSCQRHIEINSYHYQNPHTYAMTAWRNPEIERLYKILRETAWNTRIEKAPIEVQVR